MTNNESVLVGTSKVCTKCKVSKVLDKFSKVSRGKFGRAAVCQVCSKELAKQRRKQKISGDFVNLNAPNTRCKEFLADAQIKFEDKYTYGEFKGLTKQIEITCTVHKNTYKQTPLNHLKSVSGGCDDCRAEHMFGLLGKSQQDFLSDSKASHGDNYGYDRAVYKGAFEPVEIFCKRHNDYFWQAAYAHSSGGGCEECGRKDGYEKLRLTQEDFLERARNAHGDRYNLDKVKYTYNHVPVEVVCTIHGSFMISPSNLFLGRGCPMCATHGYNRDKSGSIYLLESGDTLKIGITNREVEVRLREINKSSDKDFKVVYQRRFEDGVVPYAMEYATKHYLRALYDQVGEKYDGSTECFTDVDKNYIIKILKQHAINMGEISDGD